jgi:uncharacterized protein (TIGR02001 family)
MMTYGTCLAGLAMGLASSAACAADWPDREVSLSRFDVAFGLAITSDYLVRGISQSDNHAAVQAFGEFEYGRLYAGAWTSTASFGGIANQEVDLAVGWRPQVDRFAFDFGFVSYLYLNNTGQASFGEAYAGVKYSLTKQATIGAKVNFAPNYANSGTTATYFEATADVKLPHNLGISGGVGYQAFDAAYGTRYWNANVGIYWTINKATRLDFRYSDTSLSAGSCTGLTGTGSVCGGKLLLTLAISTSVSDLGGARLHSP